MGIRIAMVAGEASGDLLGARLIEVLLKRFPDAEFFGIAGPLMERAGCEAWYPAERLAVNGITDALSRVPDLLGVRSDVMRRILARQPDLFIGVDAPDFNLGLERKLKRRGVRTVHYVSPSIWAWRGGRARKIRRSADHVLCLFPCEPALYAQHGVAATYVGHPLADEFPPDPDRLAMRERLCLPADAPVIAVLPGSRRGEVARLAEPFVGAIRLIAERKPDARFLVPLITRPTRTLFERALQAAGLPEELRVTLMFGHSHEAMIASDCVLLASGTAALEAALLKRPHVVAYRIAQWTYRLLKRFMYLPYVSLPNILSQSFVVPELLQDQCEPVQLADAVCRWLDDPDARAHAIDRFETLRQTLACDNGARAAAAIVELLGGRR